MLVSRYGYRVGACPPEDASSHRSRINQYFMRTASVGSNSMPMYMKSSAIPVSQQQDVSSTEQATENHTQSLQRIYLWGDCMNTVSTRMNP